MRMIIGISGASGAIYGIRLLQVLSTTENVETHLVISKAGEMTIHHETDWDINDVKKLADYHYNISDIGATLSSGSFKRDGMIIAPCSMKTLSALSNSYTDNLIIRAGDVTLKEKGKLVLLVRETPLHLGHIDNMKKMAEIGAIVMPPVPAFYHKPATLQDVIDHTIGKVLDVFRIEHNLFQRWSGLQEESSVNIK